jgi:uncharacterized protein (TIGR03067 family)
MRWLTVILAVTAAFLPPSRAADDDLKRETQALQGAWQVTNVEHDKNNSVGAIKSLTFVFEGNRLILKNGDRTEDQTEFKLDVTKKPKWLDTSIRPGVYSLEGDTLKILWLAPSAPRPTEVSYKSGQGQMLIYLRRMKQ